MSITNGSSVSSTSRHVPVSYTITNDQPVVALDARTAFEKLTERGIETILNVDFFFMC